MACSQQQLTQETTEDAKKSAENAQLTRNTSIFQRAASTLKSTFGMSVGDESTDKNTDTSGNDNKNNNKPADNNSNIDPKDRPLTMADIAATTAPSSTTHNPGSTATTATNPTAMATSAGIPAANAGSSPATSFR